MTGEDGGEEAAEREQRERADPREPFRFLGATRALALEAEEQADQ